MVKRGEKGRRGKEGERRVGKQTEETLRDYSCARPPASWLVQINHRELHLCICKMRITWSGWDD